ncbi:MAG TPA: nitroreductase [Candidatus Spyradocola merdavium]|nr:nitroreductase [Candidatus Spyradocola merdavium]
MTLMEAMQARHSVRQYREEVLRKEDAALLREEIEACNAESGLHIQLVCGEPKAFSGLLARYGKFSGVTNYIALVGKKGPDLSETCGYFGERIVLRAQQIGLNTCWVAMTYSKVPSAFSAGEGEKLCAVIAVGYGKTQGSGHRVKSVREVTEGEPPFPEWFVSGVEAALLAPTAMNQQKFRFALQGNRVSATAGSGFYTKLDLGIVKYHFAMGAGADAFTWDRE